MSIKDYISTKLNEEQLHAALHINTSSLILAGAGSGKTRTLTYKIAYLIFEKQIPVNQILAVTFTNKAANEMKERLVQIAKDISDEGINCTPETDPEINSGGPNNEVSSIDDFLNEIAANKSSGASYNLLTATDCKWIGTFHSIFLKMLKEDIEKLDPNHTVTKTKNPYTKNFGILDVTETTAIIKDVLKRHNMEEIFKPNEVKGFISKMKNEGMSVPLFLKRLSNDYEQSMAKLYEDYQKALEQANSLDFDDLLLLPYLLFKNNDVLQKRVNHFRYIMVDEAQDTNRIQFELMKMLSGTDGKITLIGDDFQSIYGRRGAIMENFLNVKKYRPDIQMFKLQTNYRSRPHIVTAGSHIIKNNTNQYEKNIKPYRDGDDKVTIFTHRDEMDEAANIIDLLKKMKGSKFDTRGDIAILYRTNAQSSPFEQLLVQEGIPYKIWGAFKFFDRKEIKDVLAYIKYILNPQNNVALQRIINVPTRKIGKTTLQRLEEYAITNNYSLHDVIEMIESVPVKVTPMAKNGILDFKKALHSVTDRLNELTPAQVIENLVKAIRYRAYLVKEEGNDAKADEKYENIGQLINMAGKYDNTGDEALRQFMEEVALLSDVAEDEAGELDAIKLMTVHASKGLEFPFVFVVGLEDQVFPLANAIMETKLLEEERRLMYVAITRAQDHIFLSHANSRMQRGQTKMNPPSRFLGELPEDLLKKYDLAGGSGIERDDKPKVMEGDTVKHKLFGPGYVLEVRNHLAIVKFHNPKFGVRKIESRFLDIT